MKLKTKLSTIYKYQQDADKRMGYYKACYVKIIEDVWNNTPTYKRVIPTLRATLQFFPKSFRMYSAYEDFLPMSEDVKIKLVHYRKMWHNYWSVKHQIDSVVNVNDEVWLNEWESSLLIKLQKENK